LIFAGCLFSTIGEVMAAKVLVVFFAKITKPIIYKIEDIMGKIIFSISMMEEGCVNAFQIN
jgi:hypothetical protein